MFLKARSVPASLPFVVGNVLAVKLTAFPFHKGSVAGLAVQDLRDVPGVELELRQQFLRRGSLSRERARLALSPWTFLSFALQTIAKNSPPGPVVGSTSEITAAAVRCRRPGALSAWPWPAAGSCNPAIAATTTERVARVFPAGCCISIVARNYSDSWHSHLRIVMDRAAWP